MTTDQRRQHEQQERRRLRRQARNSRRSDGHDLVAILRTRRGKAVRLVKIEPAREST